MNKLVSVYVLTYRNFDKIENTICNIAEQSYSNIELIVSDDASGNVDDRFFKKLLMPYENRFKRIIVNVNKENIGTVKHLNKILPMGQGEIILCMGADDCFASQDVIEQIVVYFKDNPDKLFVASQRIDREDLQIRPRKEIINLINRNFEKFRKRAIRMSCPIIGGIGVFLKREIFEKYGPFIEDFVLAEDVSYYYYIIMKGERIGALEKVTMMHERGGVSDRRGINPQVKKDADNVIKLLQYPYRHEYDFFTRRCIEFAYSRVETKNKLKKYLVYLIYPDVSLYRLIFWLPDILSLRNVGKRQTKDLRRC